MFQIALNYFEDLGDHLCVLQNFAGISRGISMYYVRNHKRGAQTFIQQLVIESGTIAVTILALPLDN